MSDVSAGAKSGFLATLAPYLRPRPIAALMLGIASGFPLTLLLGTMTFWLARVGIDKKTIGFAVGLTTPYTLKFLWAPFIDRIRLPVLTGLFGQRRAWLFFIQALLFVAVWMLGASDPAHHLGIFAFWAIVTAFLSGSTGGPALRNAAPASGPAPQGSVALPASAAAVPGEPPAAGAADAALSADTEAICAQAGRTSTGFAATVAEDRRLLTEAAGESDEAGARAKEKATRDVANFSYALLDMSKLAADPEVKKALATMGARVTALRGDVTKIDDKVLAGLRGTLEKACGRG